MTESPRILVVDDEAPRQTLRRVLEESGYEVETAGGQDEALRKADEQPFDAGIIDDRLPDGSGVELVGTLKDRHPHVELIVLTGQASTEAAVDALNSGATAIVTKPLDVDELLAQLRRILERQRLVAEKRAAERQLRRSESRYRSLFEGIPIGLYRMTVDGRILHANQALVEMLGYPDRKSLLQVDLPSLYVDPEQFGRRAALLERQQIVRGFEARLRRYDDEVIWVRETVQVGRAIGDRPVTYEGSLEEVTQQKRMERELRESEKRYRTVFETTGTATIILEEDTTISLVNAEFESLSGYAKEEVEGEQLPAETVAPEDFEMLMRNHRLRRRDPTAVPGQYEFQFVDRQGQRKDVLATIDLIPGTKKSVISLLDITERKRAEEELRHMQTLLNQTQTLAKVGGWEYDVASGHMTWTEEVYRIYGVDPASYDPNDVEENVGFYAPEDEARIAEAFRRAVELGEPYDLELAFHNARGERLWVRTIGRAEQRDGAVTRVYGHIMDVTVRREVSEALAGQLGRVRLLNEIAHAVAARHDLDSIFGVAVHKLEERFADVASIWLREGEGDVFTLACAGGQVRRARDEAGLTERATFPEAVTQSLMRGPLRYWSDLEEVDEPFRRLARGLHVRSAVIVPLAAEGRVLGLLVSGRREREAFSAQDRDFLEGLSRHVALAVQQARLHRNLQAAYDDLRRSQRAMMQRERLRALGEMASGIAHDINNAVSPIPLYTSLIEREADLSEEAKAHLRTIATAVHDVEETVGRMRQFYRKRDQEGFVPVALNEAVEQAIELTRPRWRDLPQERGITIDLQTSFQEGLPPVMGNEAEIRQAVTNLIFNAVDAMPDGGTLILRSRRTADPPGHLQLEVTDTGIGMDEETRRRCLEPFFSTKEERGSGMGLATVYGTVQRHDGGVEVESSPGEGTTIRLLFPIGEVPEEDMEHGVPVPPTDLRILCIDDEPVLREALQAALVGQGHRVELAEGGRSGLDLFRAAHRRGEPFDVVITDLGMPDVSGREVAQTVKAEAPQTPVILLTGWGKRLSAKREIPAFVDLMLSKPATLEALNRALALVTSGD